MEDLLWYGIAGFLVLFWSVFAALFGPAMGELLVKWYKRSMRDD